jgi:hypothetical protein
MYSHLFELIRKEEVVLFLGAGFSLKAGYPSGKELSEKIYNSLKRGERKLIQQNLGLPELTEEFVQIKNGDRGILYDLLHKEFNAAPKNTDNQQLIQSIPHFNTIITTNYDHCIEDVFQEECNVIISDSDCTLFSKDKVNLIKIHGDIKQADSILISKSDYVRYFDGNRNPILWDLVKSLLATKNIVFIGYGYEDDNIESIIKRLNEHVGSKRKEMFLISPKLSQHKIHRLSRYQIEYINETGEKFLEKLILDIRNNIKFDYEKQLVSLETFNKFCQNDQIQVSVTPKPGKNVIDGIKSLPGKTRDSKFVFSVKGELAKKILDGDFDDITNDISNIPFFGDSKMPSIKLTNGDFIDFKHTENNILFNNKETIAALWIFQTPSKSGKVSIITPNGNIYPSLTYEIYPYKNGIIKAKVYTPICVYNISMNVINEDVLNFTGTPEFHPTYTDKLTAIHWTNLLLSLSSGGFHQFYLDDRKFEKELPKNQSSITYFKNVLHYYDCVEKIENNSNEKFQRYESFTYENFDASQKIFCFLSESPYKWLTKDGFVIRSIRVPHDSGILDDFKRKKGPWVMCFSEKVSPTLNLNGREFREVYENILYKNCSLVNVEEMVDGSYKVDLRDEEEVIQVFYSKNRIIQDGDKLSLL